jgi:hypothetical protein
MKKLLAMLTLMAATAAQAVTFQDLQIMGGGYTSWTPYYAGMPLTAGTIELKGTIIPDANEMWGAKPGAGFFSVNDSNCVVDTITGASGGLVDYTKLLPALRTTGCIPTFDIVNYPFPMSSEYQLSFNSSFSVSIPIAVTPAKIYYKMLQGANNQWGSNPSALGLNAYANRTSFTFNALPINTALFDRIETKFPAIFPLANSATLTDVTYNNKVWTAKAYSTGWYVGINSAGEVWYIAPGETQEVKFADSINGKRSINPVCH